MKRIKISEPDATTIKDLKVMIEANNLTIKMLSVENQKLRQSMFDLASNGMEDIDAIIQHDTSEIVIFEFPDDKERYQIEQLKDLVVKSGNYKLAAKIRDIEKELLG